jgi:phytol kinase
MNNIIGILVSYIFVFFIIGFATVLTFLNRLSGESSRKFVHIGVANWWIIAMLFFDSPLYASIPPASFVVINYISYRKSIFKVMEREGKRRDLGTVYFAVSLLILSVITFGNNSDPYIGALGILIMGYGDGFAAVFGKRFPKYSFRILNNTKTAVGTAAMFIFSFVVAVSILSIYNPHSIFLFSILIAVISTILEVLSPWGLDNLTVPLLTPVFYVIARSYL